MNPLARRNGLTTNQLMNSNPFLNSRVSSTAYIGLWLMPFWGKRLKGVFTANGTTYLPGKIESTARRVILVESVPAKMFIK
jgi:hypothetical protein